MRTSWSINIVPFLVLAYNYCQPIRIKEYISVCLAQYNLVDSSDFSEDETNIVLHDMVQQEEYSRITDICCHTWMCLYVNDRVHE